MDALRRKFPVMPLRSPPTGWTWRQGSTADAIPHVPDRGDSDL